MKRKKNAKTTNPSTSNQLVAKSVSWDDDYYCVFSFKRVPVNRAWITLLSQELMAWANREEPDKNDIELDYRKREALRISDFLDAKGISEQTYYRWVDSGKYPELQEAHAFAKRRIGSRREYGALKDRYKEKTIHITLGHYDPLFAEEQKRLYQLQKQAIQEQMLIVAREIPVEIPNFGSSPLVKPKKTIETTEQS